MKKEEYHIIERFITSDDKNAYAELFKRYSGKVYHLALSYFHNDEDAKEIVQEVFLKIWIKRRKLISCESFPSFLYTTAKNMIFDSFKKQISNKAYLDYLTKNKFLAVTDNTEETVYYNDLEKIYTELIDELPAKRKEVFKLSRKEGYNNQQIAEKMNISVKTVEEHLYQSLKFLKLVLKQRYELILVLFTLIYLYSFY